MEPQILVLSVSKVYTIQRLHIIICNGMLVEQPIDSCLIPES